MLRKIILIAVFVFLSALVAQAAEVDGAATKSAEKVPAKTTVAASPEKRVKKNTAAEEDKYPEVYAKCTKIAEADEAKYDQIFDDCMQKNGFSQEEFSVGGMPIDSGDDD